MLEPSSSTVPTAAYDWSASPLGAPATWPHTLKVAADCVLGTPAPMLLVWGPERIVVLNEAYAALAASRSARAPGGTVPTLWPAPLSAAREALEAALAGRGSVQHAQALPFIRDSGVDVLEFDLVFTPLLDEAGAPRGAVCALGPPTAPARAAAADLRILVVEDNLDAQYLVCEMLRAFGHEVDGVAHADDALPRLASGAYDVLFTDVSLPGMSGVDLARAARARHPDLHVIFASGYGDTLVRHVDFPYASLQKPYDIDQLQAALARIREQEKLHR